MTGGPAKIIASANGCMDLPQPVELVDRAEDMEGRAAGVVVSIGPAGEVLRINLAYRHVQTGVSTAFSTGAYGLHRPARCGTHVLEPGRVVAEFSPRPLSGVFRPSPSTRTSPAMIGPRPLTWPAAWPGSPPCWTASPATPKTWPGPAGPGNSRPRPCCPAVVLSAGGWPSRTWTSARSAAPGGCQLHAGADGTSLGCVAGRAVPPRGDRAAARLHRQPIPRAMTTPARNSEAEHHCSGNWTP